jgi:hypothetical protein
MTSIGSPPERLEADPVEKQTVWRDATWTNRTTEETELRFPKCSKEVE